MAIFASRLLLQPVSKTAKQALVAELTTTLAAVLPPATFPLLKGIAQAVDYLADSILRWQARQQRPTRAVAKAPLEASATDALTRLMDGRLHEEPEPLPDESPAAIESPSISPSATSLPADPPAKTPRARLKRDLPRS